MSSRNKLASLVLSPRNKSPPTMTTGDYLEAVQTLNDSTLKQACEWLLMEDDDLDDSEQASDKKILEAYYKCESARKIVEKHQLALGSSTAFPLPLMPGAPNLNLANGSQTQAQQPQQTLAQAQQRPLPKLTSLTTSKKGGAVGVIAKGGVLPMRRTAMPKPGARLRTETTHSSSDNVEGLLSSSQPPLTKKARMGAQTSSSNSSTNVDNPRAPPPSALTFLAKLNKDGGNNNDGSTDCSGLLAPTTTNTVGLGARNPQRGMHRRPST